MFPSSVGEIVTGRCVRATLPVVLALRKGKNNFYCSVSCNITVAASCFHLKSLKHHVLSKSSTTEDRISCTRFKIQCLRCKLKHLLFCPNMLPCMCLTHQTMWRLLAGCLWLPHKPLNCTFWISQTPQQRLFFVTLHMALANIYYQTDCLQKVKCAAAPPQLAEAAASSIFTRPRRLKQVLE